MKELIGWIIAGVAVITVIFVICTFGYYQEAATFNKFTNGPKATWWDAAWAELRVDARTQP